MPVSSITVTEYYGVTHLAQLLHLDFGQTINPATNKLNGPAGTEVYFQTMTDGKTCVYSSGLTASTSATWTIVSGAATLPDPPNPVVVTETATYYEVTNGLVGIRVAKAAATPSLGPLLGLKLRNGSWATTTGLGVEQPQGTPLTVPAPTVTVLESGKLKWQAQVSYNFGGGKSYTFVAEVQAGQPSALFEEDATGLYRLQRDLFFYGVGGFIPDRGRWRGGPATDVAYGANAAGNQYQGFPNGDVGDALVTLSYGANVLCDPLYAVDRYQPGPPAYRPCAVGWSAGYFDSGWVWQLYNNAAGSGGDLVGFFTRKKSRLLGDSVGVGLRTDSNPQVGITTIMYAAARNRFAWGLFTLTKALLSAQGDHDNAVMDQFRIHSGVNLDKLKDWPYSFTDPPNGYGAWYLPASTIQGIRNWVVNDLTLTNYNYVRNAEPTIATPQDASVLDSWFGEPYLSAAADNLINAVNLIVQVVVGSGAGVEQFDYNYLNGGNKLDLDALKVDLLLADGGLNATRTAQLKRCLTATAALLWDNDFSPLQSNDQGQIAHNWSLGTANMPVQYNGYQYNAALSLGQNEPYATYAAAAATYAVNRLAESISPSGAEVSVPHYSLTVWPLWNVLVRAQRFLGTQVFNSDARLALFCEWAMAGLSPPDSQYGSLRKHVTFGDGSAEGYPLIGFLATACRDANPSLSARLMAAWHAMGKPHYGFYGSSIVMIDENAWHPPFGTAGRHTDGYWSHLRCDFGQANESAAWLVNGDYVADHRQFDRGILIYYAYNAPVLLRWGTFHDPDLPGGLFMPGSVQPAAEVPDWDQDAPNEYSGNYWSSSANGKNLTGFAEHGHADGVMEGLNLTWTHAATLVGDAMPALHSYHTFAGADAAVPKILTLNLYASGNVVTPSGTVTPALPANSPVVGGPYGYAFYADADKPRGGVKQTGITAGLKKWAFTGNHFIDIDVYLVIPASTTVDVTLGTFAHANQNATEAGQYLTAIGSDFEERLTSMRVKASGAFQVLIVPRKKGQAAPSVTAAGTTLTLTKGNVTRRIDPAFVTTVGPRTAVLPAIAATTTGGRTAVPAYGRPRRDTAVVVSTFGTGAASAGGVSVSGDPAEVVLDRNRHAKVTLQGGSGNARSVTLPGNWAVQGSPPAGLTVTGGPSVWSISTSDPTAALTVEFVPA